MHSQSIQIRLTHISNYALNYATLAAWSRSGRASKSKFKWRHWFLTFTLILIIARIENPLTVQSFICISFGKNNKCAPVVWKISGSVFQWALIYQFNHKCPYVLTVVVVIWRQGLKIPGYPLMRPIPDPLGMSGLVICNGHAWILVTQQAIWPLMCHLLQ